VPQRISFAAFSKTSFRKKFLFTYLLLLFFFLLLMFPIVSQSVQKIVFSSMNDRASELIEKLQQTSNESELIQTLKDQRHFIFYRIGILDDRQRLLYDSHTKGLMRLNFFPLQFTSHPEVKQALKEGIGYSEEYSHILNQKLIYLAKVFNFRGKKYILRLSFSHDYIDKLRHNFEIGFVLFSSVMLILFSIMTGLILHRLTNPITQIIQAVKPYQEGKTVFIPEIRMKAKAHAEFTQLANTLNSLSERIRIQIESLIHERNEKEAILEALGEGVLAVDQEMCISYANSIAIHFLHLDRSLIGIHFPRKIHPQFFELLTLCHTKGQQINEAIEIDHNGNRLHLNVVVSPREKQRGAILVLQDKSIHYKVLEMRKDFIANASHELKTPITIILGFAETLKENPDLKQEIISEIIEKIVKNCKRMATTVRNLLTLADIENLPSSRITPCDLIKLGAACKSTIESLYPHVQIEINTEQRTELEIHADLELLEVALMNLIDNAAKYSHRNRHNHPVIWLHFEKIPGFIKIVVKDNGIGIPQQDLEYIFQRFYTVNKVESKKLGGSGLGLSIVKTIVEKHFGKISVESTIGEGSIFTMLIADDIDKRIEMLVT
jgi:two-component system phosphate regulon sensor histidine kinase PhoR